VDFLLADPFFYGAQVTKACSGASTTVTGLGEAPVGLGYPSAVSSFTVQLSAAATVTNITAGVSFTVSGGTYPVTVDVLNGTVTDNGGANLIGNLSHAGSRSWMVVLPGSNTISVSAGTATFTYNDAYI
jgi:phage-related protein